MSASPAPPPARLIDPVALAARLGEPGLRIFDATVHLDRPPGGGAYSVRSGLAGYLDEHIPGAAFADIPGALSDPSSPFPFAFPDPERFAAAAAAIGIGDGTRVVAYSQHSPMWATRLWWLLRCFGFDDVEVLDGGLQAWRSAGLPLELGVSSYPPARFSPRPRPWLLAPLDDVRAASEGRAEDLLVNALPEAAFRGEGPSSYSRPGRIPASVSVPSQELLGPDGRFAAVHELRARLERSGALDDQPVVAYCGGGISATVDLFALSLAGRQDARLYDGSLTEWTADPELPVELG